MGVDKICVISLGAGVQSSTLALMATRGEVTPMPDAAIFADTGDEPEAVYRWLEYLEPLLSFPIYRVSAGRKLSEEATNVRTSKKSGKSYVEVSLPIFIINEEGKAGINLRQCTTDFKIVPIRRKLRELAGKGKEAKKVEQWIGISYDEIHRMKDSRDSWVTNRWPLIEAKMRRGDCLRWMMSNGYDRPPRSACVYCPFHCDAEWQRLKTFAPADFQKAVEFEKDLQSAYSRATIFRGKGVFLHESLKPLSEVDFSENKNGQGSLFANECEGMCGV